jgi:hypothetical protein
LIRIGIQNADPDLSVQIALFWKHFLVFQNENSFLNRPSIKITGAGANETKKYVKLKNSLKK